MFKRNYPIIFGLGTKIVTSYHHPCFKTGVMIAICDSKKPLPLNKPVSDKEFKECFDGIIKELYFSNQESLERFIAQLQSVLNNWKEQKND